MAKETNLNSTIPVQSVPELIQKIIEFPNFKYARGESKKYRTNFLPSVWRIEDIDKSPICSGSQFTVGEFRLLCKFQQDFLEGKYADRYFTAFMRSELKKPISYDNENLYHWAALAQNNGIQTRLVDVTEDLLIALYFATNSNPDENGYVHVFRDNFNTISPDNIKLVTLGKSFFDVIEVRSSATDNYPYQPTGNITSVIVPRFPNRKIERQKGAFCFTGNIDVTAYWGGQLTFEISSTEKAKIQNELRRLGYYRETLFPKT